MVRMVARLCVVFACLPAVFLGGCGGGGLAASAPDAPGVAGGHGGPSGTGGSPGGVGGEGGGTGGQLATATSSAPGVCVPGASVACACVTGQQGAQTCTAAGTFAACVCLAPSVEAGGADGSGGSAGTGGGADSGGPGGAGGSGASAGYSGTAGAAGGGPVVDAAVDLSADVPVVPDIFPGAVLDAGADGGASDTIPAIVSFAASPATISAGQSSTLSWTVTGATMLTIDQGVGSVLVTVLGTNSQAVTPTQTTTYTLTLNGSVSAQVTVTVVPLPSIMSFSASPSAVRSGGSATLTALFVGGTGTLDQGIGAVISGIGMSTGPMSADTTYTLTVTNAVGGSRRRS